MGKRLHWRRRHGRAFPPEQVKNLEEALRRLGFTPLLGRFGLGGGPYSSGFGALGDNSMAVYYYRPNGQQGSV